MKFKGNLAVLDFDLEDYRKRLHEQLSEEISRAAFIWIEEVLAEIPLWSGASWATFLRLSREIRYSLTIDSKVIRRVSYGQRHGDGEVTADSKKGLYSFTYTTDLEWLVSNEYRHNTKENDPTVWYRLLRPGPYHFQQAGQRAFEKVAGDVRLPPPWKSLKVTKRRI